MPKPNGSPPPNPLENVGALNAVLASGFRERLAIDLDIEKLIAKHVAPLREARVKLMRNLKADTDIANKDLVLFYNVFARQEEAKAGVDDDHGEAVIDNMRTMFNALARGEMLDFIDVLESTDFEPRSIRDANAAREASAGEEANEAGASGSA